MLIHHKRAEGTVYELIDLIEDQEAVRVDISEMKELISRTMDGGDNCPHRFIGVTADENIP